MSLSNEEFAAAFQDFLRQMGAQAAAEDSVFIKKLSRHFGQDPTQLPIVAATFPDHEHPNIQLAIEKLLSEAHSAELSGINNHSYFGLNLSDLVASGRGKGMGDPSLSEGPIKYINVPLGKSGELTCIQRGLLLTYNGSEPVAVLVQRPEKDRFDSKLTIEVMGRMRTPAEQFLNRIRTAMQERSVYRGRVLSLGHSRMDDLEVTIHELPDVSRDGIILPEGVLEQIERQTIRFSEHRERLRAAGRHLKRGLLLHGPPGTGKTLTAMYIARAIPDRTVLLLTGRGLGMIQRSCAMARALQPAILILEDVDLVAEERSWRGSNCSSPVLFELLNEMDGLADDADILFLLTTNRPDVLEPALSARPGRIDQAIEIPLPDRACRERLMELYSRGLSLDTRGFDSIVQRTEGASAAFIRELMRRAALLAADEGDSILVRDNHLEAALNELMVEGGPLTRSLLGFRVESRS